MTDITVGVTNGNPVIAYANRHLWGNPENDKQFQVKIWRISPEVGEINNFAYMSKWRQTPKTKKRFHIYTAGGTHPGMWNFAALFKTRNPINKWVSASIMGNRRGVQVDFYDGLGRQYPRTKTWILVTQDGLVLIAFEHLDLYDIKDTTNMFFRCYSTDMEITKSTDASNDIGNPYVYESVTYENALEYSNFATRCATVKARDGFTGIFVNGIYNQSLPSSSTLAAGDVVEFWHDPTVKRVIYYNYTDAADFYSSLDSQRKLILHPPKDGDFTFNYFDDNDYYLIGPSGKGTYFHRNAESSIRQLTHADVSISTEQIQVQSLAHTDLNDLTTLRIMVLQRETQWTLEFPWESQRIKYLYRLSDANIIKAMTGERSVLTEWEAANLESGPVMTYVRTKYPDITLEKINQALGYNAETLAISRTPMLIDIADGDSTVPIPATYINNCCIWEYDADGYLLGFYGLQNAYQFTPQYPTCAKVEFTYGQPSRDIHYEIVDDDKILSGLPELRVYISPFNIDTQTITGTLTDVTGTDYYHYDSGRLVWDKLDKANFRGVLVYDNIFLCHQFTLDHIDHSLCFSLDDVYQNVLGNLPICFANIDVWINGKSLMDGIDWIFKDRKIFINSRQHLVEGGQVITVRCTGQWEDPTKPKSECELGFVGGGVIGLNNRYNLREDRNTRIVINGKLMLLSELKTAELNLANDYTNPLNGYPYMVKHAYTPVRYAKDYDNHYLYSQARDADQRVSSYLTLYAEKNLLTVDQNMQDKYAMYSCFMNVVVNAIINGILAVPELNDNGSFIDQDVKDLCREYEWWLPVDPIIMNYDRRYFDVLPYANIDTVTVKNNEFTFLKQVNHLYLKDLLSIEGYFEVAHNVSV